jgi:hypothetical protein
MPSAECPGRDAWAVCGLKHASARALTSWLFSCSVWEAVPTAASRSHDTFIATPAELTDRAASSVAKVMKVGWAAMALFRFVRRRGSAGLAIASRAP